MSSPPGRHRDSSLPARTRRVLHLDVDAFLASVEQAEHPELRGRPVIVGGRPETRNLVMSCSYEARAFGVRPGMLAAEAARRCPRAVFRDGDSQAANRRREALARVLLEASPVVEVASIDDFFIDLTGTARLLGAACDAAAAIRAEVRERVGLPVTIGIGTSRTLARLAGKLGKPGGIAEVLPGHERAFLARLPVRQLRGVGRAIGAQLERFSIRTAGDLALVSREVLFASFGSSGLVLFDRARGVDEAPVEANVHVDPRGRLVQRPPRSIRRDSSFEPEEGRVELVQAMLAYLVDRAAARLRTHGLVCRSVEVRLGYVDTRPAHARSAAPDPGRWSSVRRRPPRPTDSTDALVRHALELLAGLPRRRALVKLVGVGLLDLVPGGVHQGELFSDPETDRAPRDGHDAGADHEEGGAAGSRADRAHRLDVALDHVRARHGFGRVLRGTSLPLAELFPLEDQGFRLRTPSLNQ